MAQNETLKKKTLFYRFLDGVEWAGNKLPHPGTLFFLFALSVIVASYVFAQLNFSVTHPGTGKEIHAVNLLSADGIRRILTTLVTNFTSFAPLGTVLVAILGVGVAEHSGLIGASLRAVMISAPKRLVTYIVVFAGILSNAASDVGYVVLIPLGGVIFMSFGRNPIAGLAAAFAGVSGGFSANLLIGTIDPLLAGITQEAAHIIDPAIQVNPAANYYFMVVSTFMLTLLGGFVTEKIVEPRLGKYTGQGAMETLSPLSSEEKKGLVYASIVSLIGIGAVAWMVVPESGILRNPQTGSILNSPFLSGIVAIAFLFFILPGIAYGLATKTIKNDSDVMKMMTKGASSMASYLVLVFFAAQFVAYFAWTNIGIITAIEGAIVLQAIGFTGLPLIVAFIVLSAIINLAMGSASAKWAILAPVFVPMFMLLGYSPELTQVAFRIGDSVSNVISPMMSFFALIVAFFHKYRKDIGLGTIIATMLPYTLVFLIGWTLMLIIWFLAGLPLGPGAELLYPSP